MADAQMKAKKNIAGKFYVDTNCISCGQCYDIAPKHFAEDQENGGFYVSAQPSSPSEIAVCEDAIKACPVESIGDNG